jgi:hypothetical protein
VSPPVRARVQTLHDFEQLTGSNIDRTCVQDFHQFRTYPHALSWDDTAACVQIRPSPAEHGRFANGVRRDYEAVLNGLALEHSSGAVEGSVNRMKMIKRQMYGRAGFELLPKRFLLAS